MRTSYIFDKNIWVTGANSGIGFEIAKQLSQYQAKLLLTSRDANKLRDASMELNGNATIYSFPADVSSNQIVNETFEFIMHEVGFPDILINCAGIYTPKSFMETTDEDFNSMINTNLKGYFNTAKCVLPAMIEQNSGAIINIMSITAMKSFKNSAAYSATKAAALAMMNCLREEVREYNIKIINIIPGAVATNIWDKQILEKHKSNMASANDIAKTVVSILELCSSDTAMLENITIKPQSGRF